MTLIPAVFAILVTGWVFLRLWPLLTIVHLYPGEDRWWFVEWFWSSPNIKAAFELTSGREALLYGSIPALCYSLLGIFSLCAAPNFDVPIGYRILIDSILFPLVIGLLFERSLRLSRARKAPVHSHGFFSEPVDVFRYFTEPVLPRVHVLPLEEALFRLRESETILQDVTHMRVAPGRMLDYAEFLPELEGAIKKHLTLDSHAFARALSEHFLIALQPYQHSSVKVPESVKQRVMRRTWEWATQRRPWFVRALKSKSIDNDIPPGLESQAPVIVEAAAALHPEFKKDSYAIKQRVIALLNSMSRANLYLLPEECFLWPAARTPVEIGSRYQEMLEATDGYWHLLSYQGLVAAEDIPFEGLVAFSSLVYAGEHRLERGDDFGVSWPEAARRIGPRLLEPAAHYLSNIHFFEHRREFSGGLTPPWHLVRLASNWDEASRDRFFESAFQTGWVDCLKILDDAPWMSSYIDRFSESPYGPINRPWRMDEGVVRH